MLRRQLSEVEERNRERLAEERKKHLELVKKVERERRIQTENLELRVEQLQQEIFKLKGKAEVLKVDVAKETEKKQDSRRKLHETDEKLIAERHLQSVLRQEWDKERKDSREERVENKQVIKQLETKIQMLKVQCGGLDMKGKMVKSLNMQVEMEKEIRKLKDENKSLLEIHKELELKLLQPKIGNDLQLNEACLKTFAEKVGERPENEMRRSLEEQKAVNIELSGYVDSVLSNIMEKYPNVLERLK
eukprot:TRINITY_DN14958_c0_g1_i3.p1 TRINITY_DN14958_c0_g1~~TRINITY_DN14958_c0_g1_i3.p1  ORF type:complete len:247 (-),score=105.47 TRINITY_DN14958_c0_g1_i3:25-765(-)